MTPRLTPLALLALLAVCSRPRAPWRLDIDILHGTIGPPAGEPVGAENRCGLALRSERWREAQRATAEGRRGFAPPP